MVSSFFLCPIWLNHGNFFLHSLAVLSHVWVRFSYIMDHYGRARSRSGASALCGDDPLQYLHTCEWTSNPRSTCTTVVGPVPYCITNRIQGVYEANQPYLNTWGRQQAPVSNLASGVRMIIIVIIPFAIWQCAALIYIANCFPPSYYSRTEFVPVGTRCASSTRAIPASSFFLLGDLFLAVHAELPAYLPLSCSPLGRYIRARHSVSIISGFLRSLRLVRPLACCLLPALLPFSFLRCLPPVGCRFLTRFRVASYRSVGVSCEAPHLLSISPSFPDDGFCTLLIFYVSAYTVLQGGLVSWYRRSPSIIVEEALFFSSWMKNNRPLAQLSGAFWANNTTYTSGVNE